MINSRIPQIAMSDFTKTLPLSCPMQKLLNKSTCSVSVENLPFDLFGSSAISEKVGQEARVTMAKAPLQCIRGWYLFIIPQYNVFVDDICRAST